MGLREKLAELREEGLQDIKQSEDLKRINEIRVKMLGKKVLHEFINRAFIILSHLVMV